MNSLIFSGKDQLTACWGGRYCDIVVRQGGVRSGGEEGNRYEQGDYCTWKTGKIGGGGIPMPGKTQGTCPKYREVTGDIVLGWRFSGSKKRRILYPFAEKRKEIPMHIYQNSHKSIFILNSGKMIQWAGITLRKHVEFEGYISVRSMAG